MFTTVYVSRSITQLGADELSALLTECRTKNRKRGLTGMLLYRDGQFIQALEGPEYMVHATMDRIHKDPRHVEVEILAEEQVKGRQFPGWSMGYREIDEAASQTMPGYRGVLTGGKGAAQSSTTEAKLLLDWFRTN